MAAKYKTATKLLYIVFLSFVCVFIFSLRGYADYTAPSQFGAQLADSSNSGCVNGNDIGSTGESCGCNQTGAVSDESCGSDSDLAQCGIVPDSEMTVNAANICEAEAASKGSCAASSTSDSSTNSNYNNTSGVSRIVGCYENGIIDFLAGIVGVVIVIAIIIGGIQYTTSAGDPQKAARARGHIINAVVALIAFMFLYGFLEFIIPGGLFNS